MINRCHVLRRMFHVSSRSLKELPKPSEAYLSQRGEQPIPLTGEELRSQEVKDIELPQATTDEKIIIKNAMKKRSLRMTFLQLFLITLLSSSTLNVMRQKNELEELEENYRKNLNWLRDSIKGAQNGDIVYEDIQDQLVHWNNRFASLGLPKFEIDGTAGIDKSRLAKKVKAQTASAVNNDKNSNEKLDRFL